MTRIICDISAYQFWGSNHRIASVGSRARLSSARGDAGASLSNEGFVRACNEYGITLPIHLQIADASESRHSEYFDYTCCSQLPPRSLVRVSADTYVVSPELCFVEMARHISLEQAVMLGYEICGIYILSDEERAPRKQPLIPLEMLQSYLESASGLYGVRNARRAVRYVVEGSASPKETQVIILLCLPKMYGGFGLPFPQMNAKVEFGERAKRLSGKSHYSLDLYWPQAGLAVEYESDLHHTASHRIALDSQRRDVLTTMLPTYISITKEQLYDVLKFQKIAKVIAGHLKHRLRIDDPAFLERHMRLRAQLFGHEQMR